MVESLATHPIVGALVAQQAVGVAIVDREHRYVRINESLARLNGASIADHLGRTVGDVLTGDLGEQADALIGSVLGGQAIVDVERAATDAEGIERTFTFSYLPLIAAEGIVGVLGLIIDSTARLRAEAELAAARRRLYVALEGTGTGTFEFDLATGEVRWSDNLGPLFGRPRGWSPGSYAEYLETIDPGDRATLGADIARARAEGAGYEREFRASHPDGSAHWRQSQVHVVRDEAGRPAVLVGLVHDIEARKRREGRAQYLARASLLLAESLDPATTLQQVADLAIAELGDSCSILVVEPSGDHRLVAVAHRDPARIPLAHELQRRYPAPADSPGGTPAVIRTGRPELQPAVTDAMLAAIARDEGHLALLQALDLGSIIVVPMVARGRTLGAITFASGRARPPFDEEDLALAEELGRRAALALDNARLFDTVRHAAVTLQRSLLPAGLPSIAGWESAARYIPGEAGAAVGGDWYDLFALPGGQHALVVGDVMGRGIPAAAGMGRLRSALQAHLFDTWDPVAALERLDDLVEALRIVPFATALVAVLEPPSGLVTLCSAGHPPPLLRGERTRVLAVEPGPPVGTRIGPRRSADVTVAPGETLMLYTDGLVEAREAPLDERLELLRGLAEGAPAGAEALVEHAVTGMLAPTTPDDVAVIAVRRTPG